MFEIDAEAWRGAGVRSEFLAYSERHAGIVASYDETSIVAGGCSCEA